MFSLMDDRMDVTFQKKVNRDAVAIHPDRAQILSLSFYHEGTKTRKYTKVIAKRYFVNLCVIVASRPKNKGSIIG